MEWFCKATERWQRYLSQRRRFNSCPVQDINIDKEQKEAIAIGKIIDYTQEQFVIMTRSADKEARDRARKILNAIGWIK